MSKLPRKPPATFSKRSQGIFLDAFSRGVPIVHAARLAGVHPKTCYREAARNEEFAAAMEEARQCMAGVAEAEAWRRSHDGVVDYVRDKDGRIVYEQNQDGSLAMVEDPLGIDDPRPKPAIKVTYSDRLLEKVLEAHSDRYRRTPLVDLNIGVGKGGVLVVPEMCRTAEEWTAKYGKELAAMHAPSSPVVDAAFSEVQAQHAVKPRLNGLPRPEAAAPAPQQPVNAEYEARNAERKAQGIRLERPDLDGRGRSGVSGKSRTF